MTKVDERHAEYWDKRYQDAQTGWDIGYANKVLTDYVEANLAKNSRILIPGAGRAYEVEYLWNKGYTNIYACDFSDIAKQTFLKINPSFPAEQYFVKDFFELDKTFDIVIEQTFFCAINPTMRVDYKNKMHAILNNGGRIYGLLFDMTKEDGPPYGGSKQEYTDLFSSDFEILQLKKCEHSIAPRMGNELVIELLKK
ncbi:MAG: SAM-dependent methyltransferase [Bacteroidia bacterium]